MKPYRTVKARASATHSGGKDIWDKVSTLTPSFVTLVLGLLGAYATYMYNERSLAERKEETKQALDQQGAQARNELEHRRQQTQDARMLAETQQLEKLFTYVSSRDPQSREFGYSMFAALGKEKLALRLINFNRDKAGAALAQRLRSSGDPTVRAAAEDSLASLRSMSDRFTIVNSSQIAAPVKNDLRDRLGLFVAYLARIGFSPPRKPIQIDKTPDNDLNAYYDPREH